MLLQAILETVNDAAGISFYVTNIMLSNYFCVCVCVTVILFLINSAIRSSSLSFKAANIKTSKRAHKHKNNNNIKLTYEKSHSHTQREWLPDAGDKNIAVVVAYICYARAE